MLILVLMLMRCVRNSGFDRPYMAEARCNVTRGRAIIRDQGSEVCEGIDKLHCLVAYLQWQMVGGVRGNSHEFGLRPSDLHPHKVGFFL